MRSWPEVLNQLERVDFEIARAAAADAAAPWMEQRSGLLKEIGALPLETAGRPELLRLAQAVARGRELESTWQKRSAQLRAEAENLYASQLLLKAMAPERRGRHFSFQS